MAKRETNTQRLVREIKRQRTFTAASQVASLIKFETEELRAGRGDKRQGTRLGDDDAWEYNGEVLIYLGDRTYNAIGRLLCRYHENSSKFLRLVADMIDGKEPYNSGNNIYDHAIFLAHQEAFNRGLPERERDPARESLFPSFSEFLNVFREQNPKLRGASARSLRRSLKRLRYSIRPSKPGRPKGK